MSREMDTSEQALFEMLNFLWNLNQDGKGYPRGITKLLKEFKCSMVSYLVKTLKDTKFIALHTQDGKREKMVTYLPNERPRPSDAIKLMEQARKKKTDYMKKSKEATTPNVQKETESIGRPYVKTGMTLEELDERMSNLQKAFDTSQLNPGPTGYAWDDSELKPKGITRDLTADERLNIIAEEAALRLKKSKEAYKQAKKEYNEAKIIVNFLGTIL